MTSTTQNPFKELRESHNFTLELMAAKIGISKQALIRLEQGTYVDPLPAALQYCSSAFPVTEYQLVTDYAAYQSLKREVNYRYFGDFKDFHTNVHPLRVLRGSRNLTEVAKTLCIPQATLTYFERNVVQQKSVPKVVLNVLHEIGYTDPEVDNFMEAYAIYRAHVVAERLTHGKRVNYGYASR